MSYEEVAKSYKKNAIETASPGKIILMLFDGALGFLTTALEGFSIENPVKRNEVINNHITKAQNIILELQSSLNMEVAGEFSQTMFGLYDFMYNQLNEANTKKSNEPIETVHRLLKELRDAWAEMLTQNNDTKPNNPDQRTFSSNA